MLLSLRQCVAEGSGTYLLVFCGTGAIAVNDLIPGSVGSAEMATTFGLVVMAVVYSLANFSGPISVRR